MSRSATVIIPLWNGRDYIEACLEAVLAQTAAVIVVDNASTDGGADLVAEKFPQVRLLRQMHNLGFAGGCNVGLKAATSDVCILLNQDAVVQPGWLAALLEPFAAPDIGLTGCKILEADGQTLNHCGGFIDMALMDTRHRGVGEPDRGQYDEAQDVDFITGAACAIRAGVLDRVGLLDELFYPGYYEDTDYCLRVRAAGYRLRYVPRAVVTHHVASTTRRNWMQRHYFYYRNRLLLAMKHQPPAHILTHILPAERAAVANLSPEELRLRSMALVEVLARRAPAGATAQAPAEAQAALFEALRHLRDYLILRQQGQPAFIHPDPTRPTRPLDPTHTLDRDLQLLDTLHEIHEVPFRSEVPVLGRAIITLRQAWNWMSTQWYVRPLITQQVRFNHHLVLTLQRLRHTLFRLDQQHWDGDATLVILADHCGRLAARLEEVEARLDKLQQ